MSPTISFLYVDFLVRKMKLRIIENTIRYGSFTEDDITVTTSFPTDLACTYHFANAFLLRYGVFEPCKRKLSESTSES
jgi:hypothetical protein